LGTLGVDVVDRGQGDVRSTRGGFDRLAPARQAVENRDDAADLMTLLAEGLDRRHGRATGADDILDDEATIVRLEQRTLDATAEAVLLDLLADEERLAIDAAGTVTAPPSLTAPAT
jgi:hypothetical protein